jgi:ribosomal protein L11 methyltransferase
VLDAGTGTGILSIAALRLGASSVVAFDNDPWAQANVLENFVLNEVGTAAVFREGSIEVVPESGFDLILANINRNVLLDLMSQFADKLDIHGHLILAGLLITDRDLMLNAAQKVHFHPVDEAIEGTWWSIVFRYEGRNS